MTFAGNLMIDRLMASRCMDSGEAIRQHAHTEEHRDSQTDKETHDQR